MESDNDDDSSFEKDEDLLLSEAIQRLLDRRGGGRVVARLPRRQDATPADGGANNKDVGRNNCNEENKHMPQRHGDAKDDAVLPDAAPAASLQALFPTGLFDSDSDESLLITCLPIGDVEQACRVSQQQQQRQPSRALQIHGASALIAQGTGLSSDDDDDDSSDDGFYKRDKKMSVRRGRMTEEKCKSRYGDASDGLFDEGDTKMPAKQNGQTNGSKRSKTSARDTLYENERQSSDESSLLSLSEKDESNRRSFASKPKPTKEPGKLTRDYDPQVGDRVYAQWMPDEWYWGHVSGYTRNKSARQGYYSVSSLPRPLFLFFSLDTLIQ
jgi:hypothetical protein